jgi:hypothetical protein
MIIYRTPMTIRDLVAWTDVFCACRALAMDEGCAAFHGLQAVLLDAVGTLVLRTACNREHIVKAAIHEVHERISID